MITTQAHRERSAHVAKEKQAEEQTDPCNRPYWPLLTILHLGQSEYRNASTTLFARPPECTIGLYQVVTMVTRTCVQEGVSRALLTQIRSSDRWHSKTDIREISLSQCRLRLLPSRVRLEVQNRQQKRVASLNINEIKLSISIVSIAMYERTDRRTGSQCDMTVNRGP